MYNTTLHEVLAAVAEVVWEAHNVEQAKKLALPEHDPHLIDHDDDHGGDEKYAYVIICVTLCQQRTQFCETCIPKQSMMGITMLFNETFLGKAAQVGRGRQGGRGGEVGD